MKNVECWNCGRHGHVSAKCNSKKKLARSEKDNNKEKKREENKKSYSAAGQVGLTENIWWTAGQQLIYVQTNHYLFQSVNIKTK